MPTLYNLIKFLHILFAIVAVGFNASYGIWLARAAKEPQHEAYALQTIRILDDRFANPAYILLLISGIAMVEVGDLDISTFWISTGMTLWVVVAVLGLAFFSPTLRKQIAVLEEKGHSSPEFERLAKKGRLLGILMAVIVLVIVFLMVTKPTL